MIVRSGAEPPESREPKRRMLVGVDSLSLMTSQPKLLAGVFNHDCTSFTSPAVEAKA